MFSGLLEEKVWTTMKNNLSPQTSVTSADQEGKAVLQITYNVTDEQVHSGHALTLTQFTCCTGFAVVRVEFFVYCIGANSNKIQAEIKVSLKNYENNIV